MPQIKISRRITAVVLLVFGVGCWVLAAPSARGETSFFSEPSSSEKTTTMSERLEKRKSELKLKLTDEVKERLTARCAGAQKVISKLKSKDFAAYDKHRQAYAKIAQRLSTMIGKLTGQGLSTAALQNAQMQFIDAVNKYLLNAQTYKTSLADLAAMNCVSDVSGFAATLQSARTGRDQLAKDAAGIQEATLAIKTALASAKQALSQQESPGRGQ